MRHTADLQLMQATALLDSDPASAARAATQILSLQPGHPEANLLLAAASRRLGQSKDALAALESLGPAYRDTAFMQLELGRAYATGGRPAEASRAFQRAVELDAGMADAWQELAKLRFAAGDEAGGDEAYARYMRLQPDPPELKDATVALTENRPDAAQSLLKRHLQQAPHDVRALRILAEIAIARDDLREAEARLTTCLALAPGYGQARFQLANLLHLLHRDTEALAHVERLLACDPQNIEYINLKAQALRLLGRVPQALELMNEAISNHPDDEHAWLLYGHLLRELGHQSRAIEMYTRAISLRPQFGHAYSSLANLKTFRFAPEHISAMETQLNAPLSHSERTHFEFALGKALEDAGKFAESFEHYARGNSLQRMLIGHNAEQTSLDVERARKLYTPEFFAERANWGHSRRDPIFIVGLPRSGSTLLEQMLASHSQVEGTRELAEIPARALETMPDPTRRAAPPYPESLETLGPQDFAALAERYLSGTQLHRSLEKPRFVDKMLANFAHIGFIHLMFPRAPIIDARRHPLGCGFSCYKQYFSRGFGFTYDQTDLGCYYRDYAKLMDHFDTVLPNRVHRVHYEQLVTDPERELRRLLDYCGLDFEPQCLRFYENRRVVQTLSSEQVRRPLYTESLEQWRNYEPWLGPMKAALGDLVDRYPLSAADAG